VKPWSVHKFGGTSVANALQYKKVAEIMQKEPGENKGIVVSAMSKVTDALIELTELAKQQNPLFSEKLELVKNKHRQCISELLPEKVGEPLQQIVEKDFQNLTEILRAIWLTRSLNERLVEYVSGHGEIWSAQILNAYLNFLNISSQWLDARKILAVQQGETSVLVNWQKSEENFHGWLSSLPSSTNSISSGDRPWIVVTGFIASEENGTPTTLKRNGSDYSASIFGALFKAQKISIWTDVDGVLSADPRLVPDAVVLEDLSYEEVTELAYFGAKVVHPSTMVPAVYNNIPIWIRNTFNPEARGTKIHKVSESNHPVKGFSTIEKVALLNLEGSGMMGVPGIAQRLFGALRESNVSVIMISQASSEHSICLAVPLIHGERAKESINRVFALEIREGAVQQVSLSTDCSILAAVGDNMAQQPGIAGKFLSALGSAQINVRAIAQGSSERNISVVVKQTDSIRALRAVHAGFFLSNFTLSLGIVGLGGIGTTLIEQISATSQKLQEELKIDLRVRAIATSQRMCLSEKGMTSFSATKEYLESHGEPLDLEKFTKFVKADHIPHAAVIDCTASDSVPEHYSLILKQGIHIITPNKKGHTGKMDFYNELKLLSRNLRRYFLYETTVGAGLPIINTLRELQRTGDQIIQIEGVFSGTLSYLFNTFSSRIPFSEVVKEAKAKGYTEPDPRDDLSGMDVARKLVILAREMGLSIELKDVLIDPLLPTDFIKGSVDDFMKKLPEFDSLILKQLEKSQSQSAVLRFTGEITKEGKARVGVKQYPANHPFARTQSTDNIVSFHTTRYSANPLIVQGPGAGREVTAGGIFADILRLASYLGAPL